MHNATIWITGASTGIGREMAISLAAKGHTVIATARSNKALEQLANNHPDRIVPLPLDLTADEDACTITQQLEQITDHLDVVLLNAGTAAYLDDVGPYLETTKAVFDINFYGAIKCIDAGLPLLKKSQQRGLIAGVCSLSYYLPLSRAEAYGASKAALAYFLESLRVDLYQHSVDVTVINPGFVKTPLTDKNDFPMPWLWTSQRAAEFIVRKLIQRPAEIRFPWPLVLSLSLGNLLPRRLYTRLAQQMVRS